MRTITKNVAAKRQNHIILIIALVVILGIVLFFLPAGRPVSTPGQVNAIRNLDPERLPDYFPNIPIDPKAKILGNYNAVSPDGRIQASRVFENTTPVGSAFNFYKGVLTKKGSGWTMMSEVNDQASPDHKALFAQSSDGILNINISAGTTPGTSVVDVSFVVQKK